MEAAGVLSPEFRGRRTLDDPGVLGAAAAVVGVVVVFLSRAHCLVLGKSFSASLSS